MFFYLLSNSTLIKEEDENTKNIKILVYGSIAYIVLHATLFIGGEDCLFSGLKPYFWMLLLLDLGVLYLVYTQKNKGSIDNNITSVFRSKEREDVKPYLLDVSESSSVNMPVPVKKKKKKRKMVSFQDQTHQPQFNTSPSGSNSLDNNYSTNNMNMNINQPPNFQNGNMLNLNIIPQSDSDSDSDITTDVDLNEFERSISL